ncbi:FAD-linked oxidoreductase [Porphyridium purpureum]|uniref:FAD-linked oxidoreductase n=1 Tax=Porphyridium purpureum TaxID=35688 RepID=A0A5J4Z2P5_PORPP|nr:FAD-linked oxidoreductase [Porphyridium purpureum]|eukprot:POR4046..scf208_2
MNGTGAHVEAPPLTLEQFRKSLRGELVLDTDAEELYRLAKQIWNGDWEIDNRPKMIVHARGVADVRSTISYAQQHGMELAVRCGGHSLKGLSTNVGGIVLDLGKHMKSVRVDLAKKEVWFEGGCLVKDVDAETAPFGFATVLGAVGNAGTGGLVSGGGYGYFSRAYGLSVDNVLEMDVVLADGSFVRASENENPDLFWACRGGQSNFGIITSFRMRLFECPKEIFGGLVLYDMEDAVKVLTAFDAFASDPQCPREASTHVYSICLSPEQKLLAVQVCYLGDPKKGMQAYERLLSSAVPVDVQSKITTYQEYQVFSDEVYRIKGIPSYWRSRNVKAGTRLPVDDLVSIINSSPSEGILVIEHFGGRICEVDPSATAYRHRDSNYVFTFTGFGFQNANARKEVKNWMNNAVELLEEYLSGGSYLNYDNGPAQASFGDNLPRLRELKLKYDPMNFFRCNINILPAV